MQISSGPKSWQTPRALPAARPDAPPAKLPAPDPDEEGDKPQLAEQIGRWVGKGAQGMAMAPQFLGSHPWILESLRLKHMTTYIEAGAGIFGGIGTLSLVAAGSKDLVDGIRHKNLAEGLIGASDIARGAYVGTWATSIALGNAPFGKEFGFASGILQTAGGLARMRHKKVAGNPVNPKVVGAIEVGQGLAWAASMVGVPVGLCFALRMGLGAARAIYTHHEDWKQWTHKQQGGPGGGGSPPGKT